MKRIVSIFIACLMIITLVGCGSSKSHKDEAQTPSASSAQKGKDYKNVIKEFEEAGFKNIKTKKLDDLVTGWLTKDGEVKSVSVDGDKDYSADDWYSKNVEVVITYHTFPEKKKDDTTPAAKSTEKPSTEKPSTEKSKYEKGYRVRFQDYDICYLIDEDALTISIFETTEPTDVYTSAYTGDFNNGIDFDWYGLKMHAHYHYWDNDAKLIITDANGIKNTADKRLVEMIEEQMK
jgi:mRNA-degrading endonuclease RelE of RelBE toxin-antitoxin system